MCLAGLSAGLNVTQKNEYNVTVLRGPSISELILSPGDIDYTGIEQPNVIVALGQEGVEHRKAMLTHLQKNTLIVQIEGVELPACNGHIHKIDLKSQGIRKTDWALASLAVLAKLGRIISTEMLEAALRIRFKDKSQKDILELIERVNIGNGV